MQRALQESYQPTVLKPELRQRAKLSECDRGVGVLETKFFIVHPGGES